MDNPKTQQLLDILFSIAQQVSASKESYLGEEASEELEVQLADELAFVNREKFEKVDELIDSLSRMEALDLVALSGLMLGVASRIAAVHGQSLAHEEEAE